MENVNMNRFGLARRKAVTLSQQELVKVQPLTEGVKLPVLLSPATPGLNLPAWAEAHRSDIENLLLCHRAILFRGFQASTVQEFDKFVRTTSEGGPLEYRDRSTPREKVGDKIYLSTIYPSDRRINLHNEGTYWKTWALKLYFGCFQAAQTGGETPIADVRAVYERIDPALRARFVEKQVMYVRNYNHGAGLRWQEVFQTDDKAEVEDYCRKNSIQLEWKDGDRLRTRQIRPAVRNHPRTGEPLWFNHAAFFHITAHEKTTREALLNAFNEEDLPYNTFYGDGTPIEPEAIEQIMDAYRAEKIAFPWHEGDVMLVDNMSVAHGRETYSGARRIVVAMTEPYSGGE
jgi:alpha-ketoglutarate-dependent taurine dioxygenase